MFKWLDQGYDYMEVKKEDGIDFYAKVVSCGCCGMAGRKGGPFCLGRWGNRCSGGCSPVVRQTDDGHCLSLPHMNVPIFGSRCLSESKRPRKVAAIDTLGGHCECAHSDT